MSHQLYYHMVPSDIRAIEHKIRALAPLSILCDRSRSSRPRVVNSLDLYEEGQQHIFYYLARTEDLEQISMREVRAQGYWSIDESESPVIEFTSCFFNGKVLREARLYWVDGFYGKDDSWLLKSEGFRAWARKVRSTVKKFLKPHGANLIGPDTASWLASSEGRLIDAFETATQ